MRLGRLVVCAVPLVVLLAGCLWPRTTGGVNWTRPFSGPVGADVIAIEVAVLEVPAGDRFINASLFTQIDDQILSPEIRQRLDENGLHVARVNGRPPDALLDLLTSERSNHNARHVRVRSNNGTNVPLGSVREVCQFQLAADGKEEMIALEQAQCMLQVTPALADEGKITVQFLPQIQHADRKRQGQLIPTIALALQGNHATDSYPALRWEVVLNPNEYVVVGTRFDKSQSLGYRFFVTAEGEKPTQRLLAIRTSRFGQPGGEISSTSNDHSKTRPLAAQAAGLLSIP